MTSNLTRNADNEHFEMLAELESELACVGYAMEDAGEVLVRVIDGAPIGGGDPIAVKSQALKQLTELRAKRRAIEERIHQIIQEKAEADYRRAVPCLAPPCRGRVLVVHRAVLLGPRFGLQRASRRTQRVARVAAKATATGDPADPDGPRPRVSLSSQGDAL